MNFTKAFIVNPGRKLKLDKLDAGDTNGFSDKEHAKALLEKTRLRLAALQQRLYAEGRRSLLIVLQGMDTSGKDGTIRHVFSGVNPQGCRVTSFKAPSTEELAHDFLWRIHKNAPGRGEIGIFNRSHYEDVLIVRVHKLVPKEAWSRRYEQINEFEKMLVENGTTILKFKLHISKKEQKERLLARLDDPEKSWKFNAQDLAERKLWDDYIEAYEDALTKCNTKHAPWFVIPSDHKWFRNLAVSRIIADALEKMNPRIPKPEGDLSKIVIK